MESENRSKIVAIATVLGTIFTGWMLYYAIVANTGRDDISDSVFNIQNDEKSSTVSSGTVSPTIEESKATILMFETCSPYLSQTCFWGEKIMSDMIKENWDEGREITSLAYTKNGWLFTMAKNSGLYGQNYRYSYDWPNDWVIEQYNKGKMITALSYSGDLWFVVFSDGSGYSGQYTHSCDWKGLSEWVEKKQNDGFFITNACYDSGNRIWRVVVSQNSPYSSQGWFFASTRNELNKGIKEDVYDKGYRIHLIENGGDKWLCVYGKYKNNNDRGQAVKIDPLSIADSVNMWTNKGYRITYVGGCPKIQD